MIVSIDLEGRRHSLRCICDECKREFVTYRYVLRRRQFHFCSRKCSNLSQKSGVLFQRVVETNKARYGCKFPTQDKRVMEKQKRTNLARYGRENNLRAGLNSYLDSVGLTNASQLPDHREKVKKTSRERYGTDHPRQSSVVKNKTNATNVERHGVDWAKRKSGVDWHAACAKRHETMKSRGQYIGVSQHESKFGDFLTSVFNDVERSVNVFGWNVDFYVKDIDTYVQFDGVYWHGLDRSVDVIAEFRSPRDKVILSTIERDKRQNEMFLSKGLKLVRVTDEAFKAACHSDTLSLIVTHIRNAGTGEDNGNRSRSNQAQSSGVKRNSTDIVGPAVETRAG